MRLLFLSHEYPPVGGGGATTCRNLAETLAGAGHEVYVVTGPEPGEKPVLGRPDGHSVRVIRVGGRRKCADHCSFLEMLSYLLMADREACRLHRKKPFDLCLAFYGIPAGPAALHLKKRYGLPYVVRIGGGDIPGFQNRFRLLYCLLAPFVRLVWKEADALTANSRGLKRMALRFSRTDRIQVVPNGVDTELFAPQRGSGEEDTEPVRLLIVCRLLKRKGIGDVISCLSDVEDRCGRKLVLTIAGSGPAEQELKEMADRSGAASAIRFTGWIPRETLPGLYRQADIFLCPSFREGMPNTVLEAMASGLPVVMRKRCPGAAELVRENGVLAEESFADAMVRILSMERSEWRKMGLKSRALAENEFSRSKNAENYLELFQTIIGKNLH